MYQDPYSSAYHYMLHGGGARFGAEEGVAPVAPAPRISNMWYTVKMMTPDCVKEAGTIALGVFGGLALFRMFSRRLPKPTGSGPGGLGGGA